MEGTDEEEDDSDEEENVDEEDEVNFVSVVSDDE